MRHLPASVLAAAVLAVLPSASSAQEAAASSAPEAAAAHGPIRAQKKLMVGAELGWNGLAGFGVNASYHVLPWLSFDAGAGMSSFRLKTGIRARANILTSEWTPFVAAGFLYGFGFGDQVFTTPVGTGETASFRVGGSPFLQLVGGVDYTSDSGFTLLGTVGYVMLLRQNVTFVSNPPSAAAQGILNTTFGSGISVGLTLGYSF
ncbi:MAG TPA: hypothetical protein VK447_01950 [Myxococcaceae bacterium]|nr:hypothetical protein [Myxococcaceae bacterium]